MAIEDLVKQFIKIYKDENLSQEIEGNELDLGIVDAGDIKRFKFWVLNESIHRFEELKFRIGHDEVKIIEAPKELSSRAVGELIIEWAPSIDIIESLTTPIYMKGSLITG